MFININDQCICIKSRNICHYSRITWPMAEQFCFYITIFYMEENYIFTTISLISNFMKVALIFLILN